MAIFLVAVKSCLTGARLFVTFRGSNAPLLRLFCQKLIRRTQEEEEEEQVYRGQEPKCWKISTLKMTPTHFK